MALYRDNMADVPDVNVKVSEGPYHFRISKVDEKVDDDLGNTFILFTCKIQDEGNWFGETVWVNCNIDTQFGKRVLKTIYAACGYEPPAEGHDPQQCLDCEFAGTVIHKESKGVTYVNIAPNSIKSIF